MADRAGVVPQLLGAAVGVVLGSALLFALLGMFRDDDPTLEVLADDAPVTEASEDAGDGSPSEDPAPAASGDPSEDAADPEPSDAPEPEPSEEPEPEPEPEPSEEPTPEPSPVAPPANDVDPAEISIQVLDAVGGEDGAAAAQAVADELREAGFNVVVVNRAGRSYERTTVFWSEGQEDGGRAVASTLRATDAEQTPTEVQLSNSVDVHVVVGADRT